MGIASNKTVYWSTFRSDADLSQDNISYFCARIYKLVVQRRRKKREGGFGERGSNKHALGEVR